MAGYHVFLLGIFADLLLLTVGQEPANNYPPKWNTASFSSLTQGVSEATAVGSVLCQLQCTDIENDQIVYEVRSGNTVQVASNGTVYLAIQLDFEQRNPLGYDLTFACADYRENQTSLLHDWVQTNAQITVNDANDNAPQFQVANAQGYAFSISEKANLGTLVEASIQTRDKDRTANAELRTMYLICNSPNATERENLPESSIAFCEKFVLNYSQVGEGVYNATVYLNQYLDYEQRPVYSSKIVAIDGPGLRVSFTTTVNIQINVIDSQDQPPLFTNPGDTATISEGAQVGTTIMDFSISARDGDTGDKRPINISIIDDPKNAFSLTYAVEVKHGEGVYASHLIIKNQLDRETNRGAYYFVLKATEMLKNTTELTLATATATYSVYVSDINDNRPLFTKDAYPISVKETDFDFVSSYMQITGLQIICYDLDEAINAKYNVTIIQQTIGQGVNAINVTDAYSISPEISYFIGNASLYLTINNPSYLDYDNPNYRVQSVVLVARELETRERYSSSTTVLITVQDVNDNAPIFDHQSYQKNISEASSVPIDLMNITAHDRDEGMNGKVTYLLEGGVSGKFNIDSDTGILRLIGALDYEKVSEYVFLVVAKDQGVEPKSSQVQVTVNVINANDLSPIFRQSQYQTSVNESSLAFLNPLSIIAVDDEAGTQQITYKIVSGQNANNSFVINAITGELTLRTYLDFTDTPRDAKGNNTGVYILLIEASDNGSPPRYATVNVSVTVIDENNHAPVLKSTKYYAVLNETVKEGTPVVQIYGTDDDAGDNGKVSYRLGEGATDNFAVYESSGLVTVGPAKFDFDVQNQYTLLIIATDGGAPQKSATATVYVNITDSNNKDPYFDKPLYFINVDDRWAVNRDILVVSAHDIDSTAKLEYSIVISSIEGHNPSSTKITNDYPYDFKKAFGVNAVTGSIYIANKLDHNIMQETTFTLMVRDINTQEGIGNGTVQIIIIIGGAEDKSITFDSVNDVYMNEDAPVGYSPITVTARDPKNQMVMDYEKVNGSEYFDVNYSTGKISLVKLIDYETDVTPNHLHMVVVIAYSNDKQQNATVSVTISVLDVNNKSPQFLEQSYTATVSESAPFPTMVLIVSAIDADSSSFGPLNFSLAGLGAEDFQIFHYPVQGGAENSRQGRVIVAQNKTLNYNTQRQYDLTLIVKDNQKSNQSSNYLSSVVPLTIVVTDVNNYIPSFLDYNKVVEIADTTPVGSIIYTVSARDDDVGNNGLVTYTLERTNYADSLTGLQLFSIDSKSGAVSVAQSLLKNSNQVFHIQVRASDNGNIPNSAIMALDIYVSSTEINDGNPKWFYPLSGHNFYAPEKTPNYVIIDAENKSQVFNVTARTGTNIIYALFPNLLNNFQINSITGEITVTASLDRDVQEKYELLVIAEDTNNTAKYQTSRSMTLILLDKNDHDASFLNPNGYKSCQTIDRPLEVSVTENMPANLTIYTLKACDPDSQKYAEIVYRMYNDTANCSRYNNISGVTVLSNGQLVTLRTIDYEQDKEFTLCVEAVSVIPSVGSGRKKRAFDQLGFQPYKDNVAYIHVNILDENDNGPKFLEKTANGIVQSNPESSPVLVVNATDLDGPGNNNILYHIESSVFYPQGGVPPGPFDGAFVLRGDQGALYATQPSYREYFGGRFVLKVVATDSANNSLTDTQEVTIYVYEKRQAIKVILDLKPEQGSKYGQTIVRELNNVPDAYEFIFLRVSEHITQNSIDTSRTDVCFMVISYNSKDILNIRQVIDLLSSSRYQSVLTTSEYHITDEGQCFPSQSSENSIKWRNLWWVLVAVAIFVFVCCVILLVFICLIYDRYKRFMETKKTYLVSQ